MLRGLASESAIGLDQNERRALIFHIVRSHRTGTSRSFHLLASGAMIARWRQSF